MQVSIIASEKDNPGLGLEIPQGGAEPVLIVVPAWQLTPHGVIALCESSRE